MGMRKGFLNLGARNPVQFFKKPTSKDYHLRIAETAFRNWRTQRKTGLRRTTSLRKLWHDAKQVTPYARTTANGLYPLPSRFGGLTRFARSFRRPIQLSRKSSLSIGHGILRKGKGAFGGLGAFKGMGSGWRKFLKGRTR